MTTEPALLDEALLTEHPLPDHSDGDGKHDRGTVLVVGATVETPGALMLAGLAALRAGAGRLQVAAPAAVAPLLAVQLPEAQVMGVELDGSGTVAATDRLMEAMAAADAVLIGSGLGEEPAGRVLLDAAVSAVAYGDGRLVIDAAAIVALGVEPGRIQSIAERTVAIPNPGEAKGIGCGLQVDEDPASAVAGLVDRFGCVFALRGPETWIASPAKRPVVERGGTVGLGTSGSGDVLAGMVAGHLARGADPFAGVIWAVHLHAAAGRLLAEQGNDLGLLARELIDAITVVRARSPHSRRTSRPATQSAT